jgi:hypothetical protein
MVELNTTKINSIAWRIKNKTLSCMLNPNQLKLLKSGSGFGRSIRNGVSKRKWTTDRRWRFKVTIYDLHDKLITSILSEPDGYFSYLGLKSDQWLQKLILQLESLQIKRCFLPTSKSTTESMALCRYFGIYSWKN